MNRNLCKKILSEGGSLIPLIINNTDSKGLGLMNPSILVEQTRILLNLRNINYTLYHCEGSQLLNGRWGPLSYLHPENDMHLRTYNFMCELDPTSLEISKYILTDTSTLDKEPLWDFVGLEDARLVRWDDKLFQCGVRRDTTPNGVGRMELSEIKEEDGKFIEINRSRIQPPKDPNSYCEKNWMPVLDMPYHFVKWTNPTELVKVNTVTGTSQQVFLGKSHIANMPDFRGGSQIIPWKNYRICMVHEVNLFNNKLSQKDATYTHRFIIWDKEWNIVKISDAFSFMDGEIEFGCGLALYKKDLLVTFGFQDNAAFLIRIPEKLIDEIFGFKKQEFDWGVINENIWFKNVINNEIFVCDSYQKYFPVEENDIVLDVGASIGPFAFSILNKNPKKIFCLEPSEELFPTLFKNTKHNKSVFCINKGISDVNGISTFRGLYNKNTQKTYNGNKLAKGITFKKFIELYDIKQIDFLKTDSEAGEYDIFNDENFEWIKRNVKKIAGEWHLSNEYLRAKFIHFRDTYLKDHPNFEVNSMDGVDIKWDLWNDHFTNFYAEVMIYMDNRPKKIEEPKKIKLAIKNFGLPINEVKNPNNESISYNEVIKKQANNEKWKSSKWPTLEITTSILEQGCIVDCVFCPQKTLINSYKGERMLTMQNFEKALETVPKEITIIFSGFSEPWLNKHTTDMLLYANKKGHPTAIFTSGIGMTKSDIDKIKSINYSHGPVNALIKNGAPVLNGGFVLHLPDNEGYSNHVINKKYIELLEHIQSVRAEISGFRIVCLGTVHDKIKDIFPEVETLELWSRGNNLSNEEKLKPALVALTNKYNKIYQGKGEVTCNCDENLYHNVLLPNGDVVLCCMDYNLDNIFGNLFTQNYNDILPLDKTPFKICNFCENGIPVNLKV